MDPDETRSRVLSTKVVSPSAVGCRDVGPTPILWVKCLLF